MTSLGRISITATLLLALSGCNNVVSIDPWFTAADARSVPKFREGLWLSVSEADCRVDVAKSAERWPDCARASFVRGNERWAMEWDSDNDRPRRRIFGGWQSDPTLIVDGDPFIGQVEMEVEPSISSDAPVDATNTEEPRWLYLYVAIRPTRFDEGGNVVAFESWGVRCGPPSEPERARNSRRRVPSDDEPAEGANRVTKQPFPGLTVIGDNCTAESADALRRAATLSESLDAHGSARWVRDGWH